MPIRGAMSAEDFAKEISECEAEMKACNMPDELREVWRKHYGRLGHKALGRFFVGMPAEAVIAKRAKSLAR